MRYYLLLIHPGDRSIPITGNTAAPCKTRCAEALHSMNPNSVGLIWTLFFPFIYKKLTYMLRDSIEQPSPNQRLIEIGRRWRLQREEVAFMRLRLGECIHHVLTEVSLLNV